MADFEIWVRDMVVDGLTARAPTAFLQLRVMLIWVLWQVPTILDSHQSKCFEISFTIKNLKDVCGLRTFRIITGFPFSISLRTG